MKRIIRSVVMLAIFAVSGPTVAADTYLGGRISNVTFSGDVILIMLDTGVPDNCIGTPYGWMVIPAEYKSMKAFVLGLWMRGDAGQVPMTVYTSGRDGSGYCQINQIDPVG
jgi:hypothetical protein